MKILLNKVLLVATLICAALSGIFTSCVEPQTTVVPKLEVTVSDTKQTSAEISILAENIQSIAYVVEKEALESPLPAVIYMSGTTLEPKKEDKKKSASGVTDENGDVWHTIAKGEVLSKIADNYNTTVKKIQALNPGLKADKIREGQRIKVYGAAEATTTAVTKKSEEKKEAPAGEVWHTIAKGEVLSKVASKYGTTLAKIKSLNPGINVDRIREGQKIRVK
jgi:LysM repeat protein